MKASHRPDMTVVIISPDTYGTIRRTIDHIKAQTVKDRLELVIVAVSPDGIEVDSRELDGLNSFQIVSLPDVNSYGEAMAGGVRAASSPLVVFAEDHVFPDPGWAEALIDSHQNGRAAVGPVMYNANPADTIGWADLLIGYSEWLYPHPGGEMSHLPGHNSSYRRDILLGYGPELDRLLEAETVLHWDLRAKGHKLYLEPRARLYHLCLGFLGTFLTVHFYMGRMFAATRSQNWPGIKRAAFTLGSPLIPFVRFFGIVRNYSGNKELLGTRPLAYPALALGLIVSAIGEMAGYALGIGDSVEKTFQYHFHRDSHVRK